MSRTDAVKELIPYYSKEEEQRAAFLKGWQNGAKGIGHPPVMRCAPWVISAYNAGYSLGEEHRHQAYDTAQEYKPFNQLDILRGQPSPNELTPEDIFHRVWTILTTHAGALENERIAFVRTFAYGIPVATEWRFQGVFGFGGKFWRRFDRTYCISCYPEEETPEKLQIIDKVNQLLREVPYYNPRDHR